MSVAEWIDTAKQVYDAYQTAKTVYNTGKTAMSYGKRAYGAMTSGGPQGFNKASRMVGGRVLTYRPSAPIVGSSRWNAMRKGLNRRGVASRETGFVDVAAAAYNMDTTGSIVLLNTIPQGASVSQRVGKKVLLKSLQCRGSVAANGTAILNDVAFMIVYDRRPTGSLPAITDILVSASSTAFNNDANSGRFQILKREDYTLTGNPLNATTITERTVVEGSFFLGLKDMPTVFKAAGTGAIGDIEQGALYLLTVGNVAAGTAAATATLAFRVRFMDV